jgi:stage V sporulation protein SpoVS
MSVAQEEVFRIKSTSNVNTTSSAMYHSIKKGHEIEMQAVGAGAVNQLYKIAVHTSGMLAREGRELLIKPGMRNVPGKIDQTDKEISIVIARIKVN